MPRFSANLGFLWPDRPLLARIDAAGAVGFKAVEFHWPYETPGKAVRAACEERGISVLGVNIARGAAKGDHGLGAVPGREQEFIASVDQAIAWCVASGAVNIHVLAGKVAPGTMNAARQVLTRNLVNAAHKAAPHNITLLLEPLNQRDAPEYFYSTVEAAEAVIHECNISNIKMMFDFYHVAVSQGDVLKRFERCMPIVGHVQIAAVPTRHEPDYGELPYATIFKELDALGYDGWVGCEYKPLGSTDQGLAWVQKLGVSL